MSDGSEKRGVIIRDGNLTLTDTKHACIVEIYMEYRELFDKIIPDAMKPQTIVRGLDQLDRIREAYRANRPDVIAEIQKEPNFNRMWHFVV